MRKLSHGNVPPRLATAMTQSTSERRLSVRLPYARESRFEETRKGIGSWLGEASLTMAEVLIYIDKMGISADFECGDRMN